MTDELIQWLESLKAGDEVAVENRGAYCIKIVHRITATQILTKNGRYAKKDGLEIASGIWHKSVLEPVTDEIRCSIKRRLLANKVAQVVKDLSNDQIDRIEQVINEVGK